MDHPRRACLLRSASRGFTIIELMVVVAMVAVIAALAAPGLRSFSAGQQVRSVTIDLTTDLLLARSEALKRNAAVSVTPRSGGWAAGWVVSSGGADLNTHEAANAAVQFTNAPTLITFNEFGRVASPTTAVRITLTSTADAQAARCIELDTSGRARATQVACT